jgi:hypothetical protein
MKRRNFFGFLGGLGLLPFLSPKTEAEETSFKRTPEIEAKYIQRTDALETFDRLWTTISSFKMLKHTTAKMDINVCGRGAENGTHAYQISAIVRREEGEIHIGNHITYTLCGNSERLRLSSKDDNLLVQVEGRNIKWACALNVLEMREK